MADDYDDDFEFLSNFRDESELKPEEIRASEVPRTFGNWMVKHQMGFGGFGLVFRAERQLTTSGRAQLGALKVTKFKEIGQRERDLYKAEVSSLLKLQDTIHVANLLDCDIKEDMPWLVSRFIKGQDLRKHLIVNGPLRKTEWLKLADNLFKALKIAHAAQIVHRDIKPENILVADGDEIFVLIDFGLAIFEDVFFDGAVGGAKPLSSVGARAGTLLYQAPEQLQRRPKSDSDIFAVGIVLYEAATGVHPWLDALGIDHYEKSPAHKPEVFKLIMDGEPSYKDMDEDQARFIESLLKKNGLDRPSAEVSLEIISAWSKTGVLDMGYYGSSFDFSKPLPAAEGVPERFEAAMGAPMDMEISKIEVRKNYAPIIKKSVSEDAGFAQRSGKSIKWLKAEKLIRNYFDELPSSDFSAVIVIKDMGSLGITGLQADDKIRVDFKIDGNFASWRMLEETLGDNVQVLDPWGRADLVLPKVGGVKYLSDKIIEVLKTSFGATPPDIRIY